MQQGIKKLQWYEHLKVAFLEINIKYAIMLGFYKSDHIMTTHIQYIVTPIMTFINAFIK